MGHTAFIDVAIGLIVVYLGASLMITVFNEWLSELSEWRKQRLAKSLQQLFNGLGFAQALPKLPGLPPLGEMLKAQGSRADPFLLARGIAAALDGGAAWSIRRRQAPIHDAAMNSASILFASRGVAVYH